MAVETRVQKDGNKWRVDMRNVDKGYGWMVFRRFRTEKAANSAAKVMREN